MLLLFASRIPIVGTGAVQVMFLTSFGWHSKLHNYTEPIVLTLRSNSIHALT